MNPELHLRIVGVLQIALAASHVFFPKRFHWNEELARLSLLNRQIFLVHNFFICFVLVLIGILSSFFPETLLLATPLSQLVLCGLTSFWAVRLAFQWFVYDPSLWRGNAFNTWIHFLFTALWIYLTLVYGGTLLFTV